MTYHTKKGKELLKQKIDAYFAECDAANESEKKTVKPYTLSGLLCFLDLSSEELDALCAHRSLRPVIGSAKRKIEAYIEENALSGKLSGRAAINSLKANFGWNDKGNEKADVGSVEVVLSEEAAALGQ